MRERSLSPEQRLDTQQRLSYRLSDALGDAMKRKPADALLLSGGVDSSLLAAIDPDVPAFTVGLRGQNNDIPRAHAVAAKLGLDWQGIEMDRTEARDIIDELIYLKGSYDPAVLNDIATYKGTRVAMENGLRRIRTGDAADTLFAGYTYLEDVPDFSHYLATLMPHFTLSPTEIGKKINVHYSYPYLDEEVRDIAMSAPYEMHTAYFASRTQADFHTRHTVQGEQQQEQRWGKILLRNAAEKLLPSEIAWRTKTDLEYGSGMYLLENELAEEVPDEKVTELTESGLQFWNKFHVYLRTRYDAMGLTPPEAGQNEYNCKGCTGGVAKGRHHCRTCGAYPADA